MSKYILVIDQGTTSSRAAIFDSKGQRLAMKGSEFKQLYPKPGWFEHDPLEIWEVSLQAMRDTVAEAGIRAEEIAGIGITNKRETTVVWNKNTGKPYYNAIVWACRRGSECCTNLIDKGYTDLVNEKTGLIIDATYSASKIKWIMDEVEGVRDDMEKGEVLFGTIDTWLLWNLTKGKVHATDPSNASRTLLYNIFDMKWDDEILEVLDIPKNILPEVKDTVGIFGYSDKSILGVEIPISGIAGDQQAALFGQACFKVGDAKNTYGTSNVPLVYIGDKTIKSEKGLLTLAWSIDNKPYYAVGASILTTGAAVKWLRDGLELIEDTPDSENLAKSVDGTEGVYFVPAFQGLAAPHWDMYARGMIVGITAGVNKAHIVRATLDSIAYQTKDLLVQIEKETGIKVNELKVDGGAANNDYLMQFQSDILDVPVIKPLDVETTSLGVAYLAGLGVGVWENLDEIEKMWKSKSEYKPNMKEEKVEELYEGWQRAVDFSRGWVKH